MLLRLNTSGENGRKGEHIGQTYYEVRAYLTNMLLRVISSGEHVIKVNTSGEYVINSKRIWRIC
jgi:hypothetical protein